MKNPGKNNDISTFMNEKAFCQGCDWFLVCYPRSEEDGRVTESFLASLELKYRKMASFIQVSCSEPPFDSSVFSFSSTNYDTFAQVLIIMNGLLFFNCCLVECK